MTTSPRSITTNRSASSRAKSKNCSTSRMAMSPRAASCEIAAPICLMIEGWMPSVGSSSARRRGRVASARPMANCCCCPPERSPPRRRSMSRSTGNSSKTSPGTVRSARGSMPRPVLRFSSTVSSGKISRPCGTRARPARARSAAVRRVISAPSHSTLPRRSGTWPTSPRMRLVLPTPLRPSTQVTSPLSAVSDTPFSAWLAP